MPSNVNDAYLSPNPSNSNFQDSTLNSAYQSMNVSATNSNYQSANNTLCDNTPRGSFNLLNKGSEGRERVYSLPEFSNSDLNVKLNNTIFDGKAPLPNSFQNNINLK